MTSITVEQVTCVFPSKQVEGGVTAVDEVSLKVKSGETVALLGPSGCGKTTLLRTIAGLMEPRHGRILYDTIPLEKVPKNERGIGMVFQDYALIPHWEAGRSVSFFLWLRKRQYEVPERVSQVSQITGFDVEKLMGRFPRQLSGGEKQRVAIARAFARDLEVLLLDEPFSNLDAHFRANARVELRRLLDRFPITSVLVTHEQAEAASLADRIALMRDGKIEQIGTYRQLLESPRTRFVAEFIGVPTMNFFDGVIEDGAWYGESFGGYQTRHDIPDGTSVTLGIRPEHVRIQSGGERATIEKITPFLPERMKLLRVWLGDETWSMSVPESTIVEEGETIQCALEPRHAMYFDARSGLRIG